MKTELEKCVLELADLFDNGRLMAETQPVLLLKYAITEIVLLRKQNEKLRNQSKRKRSSVLDIMGG